MSYYPEQVVFVVVLLVLGIIHVIDRWLMNSPYRDSEVVTDKAPTYTWSFKFGFIDIMKPDNMDRLTDSGCVATRVYWIGLCCLLFFGGSMAAHVVKHGLEVPWVKRELIVWCCSMAFWFVAFIRPYISRTQD